MVVVVVNDNAYGSRMAMMVGTATDKWYIFTYFGTRSFESSLIAL